MTFDDDIYDDDSGPSRDDFGNDFALNLYNEGPALRSGYVPLPPLENGDGTGSAGIDEGDPETFLTLRDPSRSTIDWNRFVRPATPEEIKAYDEWEERRAKEGMGAVISQVFADRRQAWEQTPKEAAYRMWLERQTGISQRMLKDPDVLRTAEMRAQMGMDALTLHDAPEQVVSWLKTPWMLEIARDDLETLKKKAEKPAWRTAEVDKITKELEQEALGAGLDKAEARQWSKMAGAFVGVTSKRYNIAPSELAKMRLARGAEETQGESFGQPPLNKDVDLGAKVNVVKAQKTMQKVPFHERDKAFTPEMRAEIAERFQNGQVVNAHTGLTVTLSKKGGLRHILSTARNTHGEGGDALYQAIPHLDQIVREAYRVESHDDRKPPASKVEGAIGNLKQVHRFLAPVDFGGENDRHVMLLVTKEYETGKAEIEDISLYDMQHAKKMSGRPSQNGSVGTEQSWNTGAPDNISVRELVDAVNDAEGRPYLYAPEGEEYQQIGTKRKNEMDASLRKHRPDMTPEQRADAISEIEKLGEEVKAGGSPKHEKAATKWLLGGHIILPEDNYKILDALKICEQQHLDPMSFSDPNEILAKYTIKENAAEKRVNPDTLPEFSDKKEYPEGITVYTVRNDKAGQAAVRKIIDTHWGEDANPWCLAARRDGSLADAWRMWQHYDSIPKRIAFQDGKLLAFCAFHRNETQWWDREDRPSKGIPQNVRENGVSAVYSLDEATGERWKIRGALKDGTRLEWYKNGEIFTEASPDGTKREFAKNGRLLWETLPDGTKREWYKSGALREEIVLCKADRRRESAVYTHRKKRFMGQGRRAAIAHYVASGRSAS